MKEDEAHAIMLKEAVERLNKCVMDACRSGLSIKLEVRLFNSMSFDSIPLLHYNVARVIKRG